MTQGGRLLVIEGLDGSGKATQAALLAKRLGEIGQRTRQVSFPDYDSESSALVKLYLSGAMGQAAEVNAYAASSFYAADRYISYHTGWKKEYQAGYTIVADRYTTSNVAHQMTKLPEEEWRSYLDWLYDYEFQRMKLPRPHQVIYLDMPPEISQKLLDGRYGGAGARDIHEGNADYLLGCRKAALYAAELLGWRVIRCYREEEPLPVDEIAEAVWNTIHQ